MFYAKRDLITFLYRQYLKGNGWCTLNDSALECANVLFNESYLDRRLDPGGQACFHITAKGMALALLWQDAFLRQRIGDDNS